MRKMSVYDESTSKYSFFGWSNRKGIFMKLQAFEENKEDDSYSGFDFPGAFACIAEDGSIQLDPKNAEDILNSEYKMTESQTEKFKRLKKILGALSIIFLILAFPMSFINEYFFRFFMAMSLICIGFAQKSAFVFDIMKRILHNKEYMQKCRFHGAEHAAINAYYDLKRVPTMEEIKKYSLYSYRCGVLEGTKAIWPYLGIGICALLPGIWYILALVIFLIGSHAAYKKKLFFTEIVWIAEPSDFEYDAAIKAMTAAIEKKKVIEKEFGEDILSVMQRFEKILENIDGNVVVIDGDSD